jgi:hypothetical protein
MAFSSAKNTLANFHFGLSSTLMTVNASLPELWRESPKK